MERRPPRRGRDLRRSRPALVAFLGLGYFEHDCATTDTNCPSKTAAIAADGADFTSLGENIGAQVPGNTYVNQEAQFMAESANCPQPTNPSTCPFTETTGHFLNNVSTTAISVGIAEDLNATSYNSATYGPTLSSSTPRSSSAIRREPGKEYRACLPPLPSRFNGLPPHHLQNGAGSLAGGVACLVLFRCADNHLAGLGRPCLYLANALHCRSTEFRHASCQIPGTPSNLYSSSPPW